MQSKLDVKPLTINKAYTGRRFKTDLYHKYEKEVIYKLKPMAIPDGKLYLKLSFGFSNTNTDIDNPIKCFVDILQKKYRFNDNRIYRLEVDKHKVAKGKEFIEFEIKELNK